jgi:hypothetical protein
MKHLVLGFSIFCAAGFAAPAQTEDKIAVTRALRWLESVQGQDGGWGQDGGGTSHARLGERLETSGNDVANTAVAVLALLRSGSTPAKGPHAKAIAKGVDFILRSVENSPADGLAVTGLQGTQIQRKLGPYIDTFFTSMLLSEIDGEMESNTANARVRASLEKVVRKIEAAQLKDGSWNISGGWAPILGTSVASRGIYRAQQKGVRVAGTTIARSDAYTQGNADAVVAADAAKRPAGAVSGAGAGVALYERAQILEQLSRTERDRRKNEKVITAISKELSTPAMVNGFGSMGGEEFFSYLNISDSLKRAGGPAWDNWNREIKTKLVKLQNEDGTWAGHHCITGRVAVTSAAVLTLASEREPIQRVSKQ